MKKTLKNILYALPIVAAGILSSNNANGQDFVRPVGIINMFQSQDATENAKIYNKAKTKEQRDSIISKRLEEDWVNTIQGRITPTVWDCNQYMQQLEINSHDWGKNIYYGDNPMYNGYEGFDLEQIYQNKGTLKDEGKSGLPIYYLSLYDETTLPGGHAMNAILTGDDATKFEDWTFIEPQKDAINVKPGQYYFPKDCKEVQVYYTYIFKNHSHEKNYYNWLMMQWSIKNGVATKTYDITTDTTPVQVYDNKPLNEVVKLITQRKDIETGIFNRPNLEQITKIYPNPATDYINIEVPLSNIVNTKVYSIEGKLWFEKSSDTNQSISVDVLPPGIYFIKATSGSYTYTGKFIKQ